MRHYSIEPNYIKYYSIGILNVTYLRRLLFNLLFDTQFDQQSIKYNKFYLKPYIYLKTQMGNTYNNLCCTKEGGGKESKQQSKLIKEGKGPVGPNAIHHYLKPKPQSKSRDINGSLILKIKKTQMNLEELDKYFNLYFNLGDARVVLDF